MFASTDRIPFLLGQKIANILVHQVVDCAESILLMEQTEMSRNENLGIIRMRIESMFAGQHK